MAKSVLVVGDIMVDHYVHVKTDRMAPEAPIAVWDIVRKETRLGGAANVAHNLKALGGEDIEVDLAGIVGVHYSAEIKKAGINVNGDLTVGRQELNMIKERYIDQDLRIVFRVDNLKRFPEESADVLATDLIRTLTHSYDAIVFSDYDKGTITPKVIEAIKFSAATNLYVVDSKRVNLSMYDGMDLLKVNEQEYSTQVSRGPYTNVESLFKAVVVTKGGKGAQLRQGVKQITDRRLENEPKLLQSSSNRYIVEAEDFPTIAVKAVDVTGCGDTHTAAMTFSLLKNPDLRMAVKFANECARNVVQKFGTSVVSR